MKKIFLTGASAGIGLATAKALVAAGHEVWGTSRDPHRIPNLPRLHGVALDLSNVNSIHQCFERALHEAGNFDVVINNAGSGHFGPADSLSTDLWRQQFQILVFAQIELCQLALRAMKERGHGLIINITSLAARLPVPYMSAYNAAKAAMASFVMTWQVELQKTNIHLVDLQPADICTGFNDSVTKTQSLDPHSSTAAARAWEIVEKNMKAAPRPALVAEAISGLMQQEHPPARVTIGGTFQARIAPLIFRFLPQGVRVWGLRNYYGIKASS